jgi:hypothetical protein
MNGEVHIGVMNGEIHSQTVSPRRVTSNSRPDVPSQISTFPFCSRSALEM